MPELNLKKMSTYNIVGGFILRHHKMHLCNRLYTSSCMGHPCKCISVIGLRGKHKQRKQILVNKYLFCPISND